MSFNAKEAEEWARGRMGAGNLEVPLARDLLSALSLLKESGRALEELRAATEADYAHVWGLSKEADRARRRYIKDGPDRRLARVLKAAEVAKAKVAKLRAAGVLKEGE